ncbi:MAG TPA: DNA repair protein RadC [Dehalococcoidia bacterium]|nr:DNA repair protein RadC [Dehalococcoidia bacterium]
MGDESYTVRDMPTSDRPRERLAKLGGEALSPAELLALVLGRGTRGESVLVTSQKLLNRFGSLKGVLSASLEQLDDVNGMGLAKAAQLKAIQEIARRLDDPDYNRPAGPVVKGPDEALRAVKPKLKGKKKEHFYTVLLDTRGRVIGTHEVSMGSLDSSIVHPREALQSAVFQKAIKGTAASVIFVHNHPSGDPRPSEEDIKLTKRLVEAGNIVGIEVLDHLIVCDSDYISMKAKGLM